MRCAALAICACALMQSATVAAPAPLRQMRVVTRRLAARLPASTAFEVLDLSSGYVTGYNADLSMPAASTIKVPVMVEVFRQVERHRLTLERRVTLERRDKDDGSGDLCYARSGTSYTVAELMKRMIDVSDNTAANMLIRLVGRKNVNRDMRALGLKHTHLYGYIRTQGWAIRNTLRTSPADMVHLLALMAAHRLVDPSASSSMIAILENDEFNTLLPATLPDDVLVAHKTGSLFDTLNDVGIVYADGAPYVIAVMTTALPSARSGRSFIHALSRTVYRAEMRLGAWRVARGLATFDIGDAGALPNAPDVRYWDNAPGSQ